MDDGREGVRDGRPHHRRHPRPRRRHPAQGQLDPGRADPQGRPGAVRGGGPAAAVPEGGPDPRRAEPGGGPERRAAAAPAAGSARPTLDRPRSPEKLPWLISFDEFVEGRRYQGRSEIAVRVAGMGGGTTVLNEAVSLTVLAGCRAAHPAVRLRRVHGQRPADHRPARSSSTRTRTSPTRSRRRRALQVPGHQPVHRTRATTRPTYAGRLQTDQQARAARTCSRSST